MAQSTSKVIAKKPIAAPKKAANETTKKEVGSGVEEKKSGQGIVDLAYLSANALTLQKQNSFLKKMLVGSLVWGSLMSLISFGFFVAGPQAKYFATSPSGTITPLQPLDQPMMTSAQVSNFAGEAVVELLSVDFLTWQRELSDAADYFVPEAFDAVVAEMEASGYLEDIRRNFYIANAFPSKAPIIARTGVRAGRFTWEVQFPLTVSLISKSGSKSQNFNVTVFVERAPVFEKPRNLAISKVVLA